jgi:5-methylcytosine-specific restriction endonuclease McrA
MGYLDNIDTDKIVKRKIKREKQLLNKHKSKFNSVLQKNPTYKEYIRSSVWNKKRKAYYKNNKRECFICKSTEKICLHHLNYKRLGKEKDSDLVPLCWEHHGQLHRVAGFDKDKGFSFLEQEQSAIEFYEFCKTL